LKTSIGKRCSKPRNQFKPYTREELARKSGIIAQSPHGGKYTQK